MHPPAHDVVTDEPLRAGPEIALGTLLELPPGITLGTEMCLAHRSSPLNETFWGVGFHYPLLVESQLLFRTGAGLSAFLQG